MEENEEEAKNENEEHTKRLEKAQQYIEEIDAHINKQTNEFN